LKKQQVKDTYYLIFLGGWRIVHSIWKQIDVDDLLIQMHVPVIPTNARLALLFMMTLHVFVFAFAFYYKILFE
jgi:hypothetical protein